MVHFQTCYITYEESVKGDPTRPQCKHVSKRVHTNYAFSVSSSSSSPPEPTLSGPLSSPPTPTATLSGHRHGKKWTDDESGALRP
eukprot:UN00991